MKSKSNLNEIKVKIKNIDFYHTSVDELYEFYQIDDKML